MQGKSVWNMIMTNCFESPPLDWEAYADLYTILAPILDSRDPRLDRDIKAMILAAHHVLADAWCLQHSRWTSNNDRLSQ